MIKTTIKGGVFFLIPIVFVTLVLGKALQITAQMAAPLDAAIPFDDVAGVGVLGILAVFILLLLCFLAGLASNLPVISRRVEALDALMVDMAPGYAVVKTTLGGLAQEDGASEALKTVFVSFDDHEALAYEVERVTTPTGIEKVIVFLPGAPSAWSGTSVVVPADRVQPLPLSLSQSMKLLRVLGRGSGAVLAENRARLAAGEEIDSS